MSGIRVRDLMTTHVATVRASDALLVVHDLMMGRGIRHVPVVGDDGELEGLVSHRDLLRHALAAADELPVATRRDFLRSIRAEEVMVRDVEVAEPDQPLAAAAAVMLENKFGCLPVVDDRRLVGILTEADFVRFVMERQ